MNLVQINERLKDLPMQVIQQYANGMNPEVPPYLALGELQRRELAQKQMATAQGGAQGPQPSVKEQVEQKAGLMAAQALQQQQAMQQMQQPRGPMPAPAGVPQPESQPQPEAMMASGGLTRAPVNFNFQTGGIVAFNGETGSDVKPKYETRIDKLYRENREKAKAEEAERLEAIRAAGNETMPYGEQMRNVGRAIDRAVPDPVELLKTLVSAPGYGLSKGAAPAAPDTPRMTSPQPTEQTYVRKAGPTPPTPPAPIADLKALAEQKQRQQGPRPAPAAAAPQAAPGGQESELSRLAMEALRNPAKAMTPEEAMAREGKLAAGYGLDKPFGEEERGLLAALKQRQAQYAAGRPSAELGAVLRGFGQGYGGAGAAGERASRETYDMDIANQREMLNAINAINKTNLETGRERYKTSGALFGKDQESTTAANRERMQSLGQMSTAEANRKTQERGQDIQVQVAKIQAAAAQAARELGADNKAITAAEAAYARDPEAAIIKKRLESPLFTNNPAKAAPDLARLREIQASKYKQFGITLEGAPGAPQGPGGTRPPLSSFQR